MATVAMAPKAPAADDQLHQDTSTRRTRSLSLSPTCADQDPLHLTNGVRRTHSVTLSPAPFTAGSYYTTSIGSAWPKPPPFYPLEKPRGSPPYPHRAKQRPLKNRSPPKAFSKGRASAQSARRKTAAALDDCVLLPRTPSPKAAAATEIFAEVMTSIARTNQEHPTFYPSTSSGSISSHSVTVLRPPAPPAPTPSAAPLLPPAHARTDKPDTQLPPGRISTSSSCASFQSASSSFSQDASCAAATTTTSCSSPLASPSSSFSTPFGNRCQKRVSFANLPALEGSPASPPDNPQLRPITNPTFPPCFPTSAPAVTTQPRIPCFTPAHARAAPTTSATAPSPRTPTASASAGPLPLDAIPSAPSAPPPLDPTPSAPAAPLPLDAIPSAPSAPPPLDPTPSAPSAPAAPLSLDLTPVAPSAPPPLTAAPPAVEPAACAYPAPSTPSTPSPTHSSGQGCHSPTTNEAVLATLDHPAYSNAFIRPLRVDFITPPAPAPLPPPPAQEPAYTPHPPACVSCFHLVSSPLHCAEAPPPTPSSVLAPRPNPLHSAPSPPTPAPLDAPKALTDIPPEHCHGCFHPAVTLPKLCLETTATPVPQSNVPRFDAPCAAPPRPRDSNQTGLEAPTDVSAPHTPPISPRVSVHADNPFKAPTLMTHLLGLSCARTTADAAADCSTHNELATPASPELAAPLQHNLPPTPSSNLPVPPAADAPTPLAADPPSPLAAAPPTPVAADTPADPPTPAAAEPSSPPADNAPTPHAADPPTPQAAHPPTPPAADLPTPPSTPKTAAVVSKQPLPAVAPPKSGFGQYLLQKHAAVKRAMLPKPKADAPPAPSAADALAAKVKVKSASSRPKAKVAVQPKAEAAQLDAAVAVAAAQPKAAAGTSSAAAGPALRPSSSAAQQSKRRSDSMALASLDRNGYMPQRSGWGFLMWDSSAAVQRKPEASAASLFGFEAALVAKQAQVAQDCRVGGGGPSFWAARGKAPEGGAIKEEATEEEGAKGPVRVQRAKQRAPALFGCSMFRRGGKDVRIVAHATQVVV